MNRTIGLSPYERRLAENEREANVFAMCLLMPEHLVLKWLEKRGKEIDLCDDKLISDLAKAFQVPTTVAALRLVDLGKLSRL